MKLSNNKWLVILVLLMVLSITLSLFSGCENEQNSIDSSYSEQECQERYSKALELIEAGKYTEAYYALKECGNFADSKALLSKFSVIYKSKEFIDYTKSGETRQHYKEEYDEHGNKTAYIAYDSNKNIEHKYRYEHDYYEDNSIKTTIKFIDIVDFEEINITNKTVYERDENGKPVCVTEYDSLGGILNKRIYEYNNRGEKILYIKYKFDNIIESQIEYEYDEDGLLVSEKQYDKNKNLEETKKYTYDKNGNELSESKFDSEGNIKYKAECGYDKHEREILYTVYEIGNDGLTVKYKLEHKYNDNGDIIGSVEYDTNNVICNNRKYEYDKYGHRTRYSVVDVEGWLRHEVKYGAVIVSYNP